MNNNKTYAARWLILPALFCSMAVLAGDGGPAEPFGAAPQSSQSALALDDSTPVGAAAADDADSGNTARPQNFGNAELSNAPNANAQAQKLGKSANGFVDDAKETSSLNTGYVGGNTRIGVGIDSQFKGKADLSHVFAEDGKSATIGQGYVGVDPRSGQSSGHVTGAGVKVSQHWVSNDANGQPDHVNKVFGAYDQNGTGDKSGKQGKKLTVGYGQETEKMFWSGSVSKGLSGKQDTGTKDANGNTIFEKAYDYGVGGRVGTFMSEQQMRVQGGLDYEWGSEHAANEGKAKQVTLSGSAEKFFPGTPHSINVDLDVHKKSGGLVEGSQKAEVRGGVGYRYDIASDAGIWQADQQYKRVRVEIPGEPVQHAAKVERKLVKHTMELEGDTFFQVDKAVLTPEAQKRLQAVVAQMRDAGHEGNIRISGHTCDIGSEEHNKKLSERRANAVRDFLAKNGFNADELISEGVGKANPKYPNTTAERHKNRRVDIEYVTHQAKYKDEVVEEGGTTPTDPKVVWKQELIPSPPLWVRQALHNVADHKERVDTYKTTAGGAPAAPGACKIAATNDAYSVTKDSTANSLGVQANDTHCTGAVTITGTTNPTHGTVTVGTGGDVLYTPTTGYVGADSFTYTITDTDGNTSTATVELNITSAATCKVQAVGDSYPVAVNSGANSLGVQANDTNCGGAVAITGITQPSNGSVAIVGDHVTYTPNTGYMGHDSFTYTVTEGGNTSTATVGVDVGTCVTSCTGGLKAVDDSLDVTINDATTHNIAVLGNDTGTGLKIVSVSTPPYGTATISADGQSINYTLRHGYCSSHSFTYTVQDSAGNLATATVQINVL